MINSRSWSCLVNWIVRETQGSQQLVNRWSHFQLEMVMQHQEMHYKLTAVSSLYEYCLLCKKWFPPPEPQTGGEHHKWSSLMVLNQYWKSTGGKRFYSTAHHYLKTWWVLVWNLCKSSDHWYNSCFDSRMRFLIHHIRSHKNFKL